MGNRLKEIKPKKVIRWIASLLLIASGVLIAGKFKNFEYSYFMFFIGHLIFVVDFLKQKNYSYASANIFFLCIDLLGIYKWIL